MAIYHASVKAFSRGQGHSGTAAAAYRAGIVIADELTGTRHDYTRRKGVASVDMLAPVGAPDWARDPAACFNASEMAETRANARVGREVEVALPAELDETQRHALALDLGQLLVDRYQVGVLVAVHKPDKGGDERNHHCHLLMTPRQIGPEGLGARACAEFDARGGAGPQAIRALREAVAERINEHLTRAQVADRVDHRSLAKQAEAAEAEGRIGFAAALAREPTQHEGKAATAMRRRGEHSDRAQVNDSIQNANRVELRAFLELLEKEGRLMETPARHSQEAAQDERRTERATARRPVSTPTPPKAPGSATTPRGTSAPRAGTRPRAGPAAKVQRPVGLKGRDAAYYNQRAAEAEERMRDAQHAAEQWLAAIEKSARDSARWVQRLIEACNPERARVHAHAPGFLTMAAELRQDMRQAVRDDTRWDRRQERERFTQWALEDAKRRHDHDEKKDPQPSIWDGPTSRREWAERRRQRADKVEGVREDRNRARRATGPEAQEKYTKQAQDSMARLERTLATLEARYPLETDQADALPQGPPAQVGPGQRPAAPSLETETDQQRKRRGSALPPLVPPARPRLR